MSNLPEAIFKLGIDIDRLPYEAYNRIDSRIELWRDLFTDPYPYDEEFGTKNNGRSLFMRTDKTAEIRGISKYIVMFGWFDLLEFTEMPTNDFSWTIISKNFLDVVKKLGFTEYRLINLRIIERSQFNNVSDKNPRAYEDDTNVKDLIYDDEMFYGFQVLSEINLLTDDSDVLSNEITWLENIPKIPFFFREKNHGGGLLVNQQARNSLEKAGIRGIRFTEPFGI